MAGQTTTNDAVIAPFSQATITDPNNGVHTLTIQLTAGGAPTSGAGVLAESAGQPALTYGGNGLYTLAPGSVAVVQSELRALIFTPAATAPNSSTTTGFSITDTSTDAPNLPGTDSVTTVIDVHAAPAPPPMQQTAAQQAGLPTGFSNLTRSDPGSAADMTPGTSLYAQAQAEANVEAQYNAGRIFIQDAQSMQFHLVDGTVSLAEISYAFFTGSTPTAAGLNYLVNSPANPNDLNDGYYQRFSVDNRYINFAVNLATGGGAGVAAFAANYGALSLTDAATKAYAAVFGVAPAAGKIAAILNEAVPNGLGGTETRAQYLADVSGGTAIAQKAALVGYFLADSLREGGTYAAADQHFLADLAHGTAAYNVDLIAAYGPAPTTVGTPASDPTVPH